jgi:hypothetical protein
MKARRARAALATATILAGLATGLALGDSAAQDTGSATSAVATTAATDKPGADPVPAGAPEVATDPPPATTQATTVVTDLATGAETTAKTTVVPPPPAAVTGVAVASAHKQPPASKWQEAAASCRANPRRPGDLLGVQSTSTGRDRPWLTSTLGLVFGVAVLALLAMLVLGRGDKSKLIRESPLAVLVGLVAVLSGLGTLATSFVPGIGVRERPGPRVVMTVREVHSRIARQTYDARIHHRSTARGALTKAALTSTAAEEKVRAGGKPGRSVTFGHQRYLDGIEIGNVAWLEIRLTGYRGKHLKLQTALFHPEPGGALIPDSDDVEDLEVDGGGDQSVLFKPVWFGLPRLPRFRAEFRVLEEDDDLVQMATTKAMQGIAYRYACPPP